MTEMRVHTFIPVGSEQIARIAYDPNTRLMLVEFAPRKSDGLRSVYEYKNVDVATYNGLMEASHLYGYFARVIKAEPQKFPYRKLEPA